MVAACGRATRLHQVQELCVKVRMVRQPVKHNVLGLLRAASSSSGNGSSRGRQWTHVLSSRTQHAHGRGARMRAVRATMLVAPKHGPRVVPGPTRTCMPRMRYLW